MHNTNLKDIIALASLSYSIFYFFWGGEGAGLFPIFILLASCSSNHWVSANHGDTDIRGWFRRSESTSALLAMQRCIVLQLTTLARILMFIWKSQSRRTEIWRLGTVVVRHVALCRREKAMFGEHAKVAWTKWKSLSWYELVKSFKLPLWACLFEQTVANRISWPSILFPPLQKCRWREQILNWWECIFSYCLHKDNTFGRRMMRHSIIPSKIPHFVDWCIPNSRRWMQPDGGMKQSWQRKSCQTQWEGLAKNHGKKRIRRTVKLGTCLCFLNFPKKTGPVILSVFFPRNLQMNRPD